MAVIWSASVIITRKGFLVIPMSVAIPPTEERTTHLVRSSYAARDMS